MTLKEAVAKAEREFGKKVVAVSECDDRWFFEFDFGESVLTGFIPCCYKSTGEVGWFSPFDEPGLLSSAKPVPLPE